MKLTDVFCYAVLTITVAASWVEAENQKQNLEERSMNKRLKRRESTMLIDNFPMETVFQKPKVIYRRISRQKYRVPKPKPRYGPPRPKYGPPKSSRKPGKKYFGKAVNPKYGPPSYKKRTAKPKPRYGTPKRPIKPAYGPPKKNPHYSYYPPETVGFGEPPSDFFNDFPPQKQKHGEHSVDSYGVPIKTTLSDIVSTSQRYPDTFENFGQFDQEYQSWKSFQRDQELDNGYAFSKKRPTIVKPEADVFVTPVAPDLNEDNINSYSDLYSYRQSLKEKKKKPQYIKNISSKIVNMPSKAKKKQSMDEEIIVGGQYAEPPARYVPKFQPSAAMFSENEDDFSPQSYADAEIAVSATSSPYVNYKNSNVAFNPQNLNDAFGIVEE